MSIQPLRDFILVTKTVDEERVPGSMLFRPATAETKIVKGTVLAVGTGRVCSDGTIVPLEVKVGDTVVFNKNFATEVSEGSESALVLREDQLLCVIR